MPRRKSKTLGDWRDDAICIEYETNTFYPERSHELAKVAKAICRECPVRSECLDEAIANNEKFGVWGGLDTQERQREARRRYEQERRNRAS